MQSRVNIGGPSREVASPSRRHDQILRQKITQDRIDINLDDGAVGIRKHQHSQIDKFVLRRRRAQSAPDRRRHLVEDGDRAARVVGKEALAVQFALGDAVAAAEVAGQRWSIGRCPGSGGRG